MGWLRVVSGRWRGRRLSAGSGRGAETIRPTADRVRTALFDHLMPRLPGARVLDLCAGTGALGIEALSRGAEHVTFVDRSGEAIRLLNANLAALGIARSDEVEVRRDEALRALRSFERTGTRFDLILVDPPYATTIATAIVGELASGVHLTEGGWVVVEHDRRTPIPASGRLTCHDERPFGDTTLSFYSRQEGGGDHADRAVSRDV